MIAGQTANGWLDEKDRILGLEVWLNFITSKLSLSCYIFDFPVLEKNGKKSLVVGSNLEGFQT